MQALETCDDDEPLSPDGLMDGRMDGWMEGWMDGRMDGWKEDMRMDEWNSGQPILSQCSITYD